MNFGFSGEMIFLFFLALILFGPKKMPEIGRQVARFLNEFRRASNEFRSQIESGLASLTANQGHSGIPVAPPNPVAAPPRPELSGLPTVSAAELTATLDAQRQEADRAEAGVDVSF